MDYSGDVRSSAAELLLAVRSKDLHKEHQWPDMVLVCIDGRFVVQTILWATAEIGPLFDLFTEIGSVREIVEQNKGWLMLCDEIKKGRALHGTHRIWIIAHHDCGAYADATRSMTEEEEKQFMIEQLRAARNVLLKHFPDLEVKMVWVEPDQIEEAL